MGVYKRCGDTLLHTKEENRYILIENSKNVALEHSAITPELDSNR